MAECKYDKLIYNALIKNCSEVDSSLFNAELSLYEVVRIIDGVAIFLEDHLSRLEESVRISGRRTLVEKEAIIRGIYDLIAELKEDCGNIRISLNYTEEIDYYLIYFIESRYPDSDMYSSGVTSVLYNAVRENPNVKVSNYMLRSLIYDKLVRYKAYEALLVNSDNCITEGSKSNVFFVKNKTIITAPDNVVLPGITRRYIIDLCLKLGIEIDLRCLNIEELIDVDSVFISGTSPRILTLSSLEDYQFSVSNTQIEQLTSAYNNLIKEYIESH